MIGGVQPVQLPYQIEGALSRSGRLTIATPNQIAECNPIKSVLAADLYNLIPSFPRQLISGMAWTDSVEFATCQALIPTTVHLVRSYTVSGQLIVEGHTAVVIQRADRITAHGTGAQQQHHIEIDAAGTGRATYYLDLVLGQVVKLVTDQNLVLKITAAGKNSSFSQSLRQSFELVP
jgi:hypothetical protein